MASAAIDHLVATTVLIVAFFIFMNLFSQTLQAALLYQFHMHLATKCSDLLDNILLSFGNMSGVFGLGDYDLEPYMLNPYYVMKLTSASGTLVEYPPGSGIIYSNKALNEFLKEADEKVIEIKDTISINDLIKYKTFLEEDSLSFR